MISKFNKNIYCLQTIKHLHLKDKVSNVINYLFFKMNLQYG